MVAAYLLLVLFPVLQEGGDLAGHVGDVTCRTGERESNEKTQDDKLLGSGLVSGKMLLGQNEALGLRVVAHWRQPFVTSGEQKYYN